MDKHSSLVLKCVDYGRMIWHLGPGLTRLMAVAKTFRQTQN
jgi:hypothetical protein